MKTLDISPRGQRIYKRLLVLAIGVFFVWLAAYKVFPFFDNRTPLILALSLTYVAMAYGIIPLAFRLVRLFYHPVHLPLYCTTPDGFASDPINIALIGNRQQVILAMEAAGWYLADRRSFLAAARQLYAALLRKAYPRAPMSQLYLFGRGQDLAFEKEIIGTRGNRHHVRFWAADEKLADEFTTHVQFWQRFHRPTRAHPHAHLWIGAASKDIGIAPIRHNAQVTHKVEANTALERELIIRDLKHTHQLHHTRTVTVHRPFSLRNRALASRLDTDGKLAIVTLR